MPMKVQIALHKVFEVDFEEPHLKRLLLERLQKDGHNGETVGSDEIHDAILTQLDEDGEAIYGETSFELGDFTIDLDKDITLEVPKEDLNYEVADEDE